MNNEPVAYIDNVWINRPDLAMDLGIGQMFSRCQLSDHQIPLYTHEYERPHNTVLVPCDKLAEMQAEIETLKAHPVKELDEQFKKGFEAGKEEGWKARKFHHPVKELTDEEIIKVYEDMLGVASAKGSAIDFARAILRKAQEK